MWVWCAFGVRLVWVWSLFNLCLTPVSSGSRQDKAGIKKEQKTESFALYIFILVVEGGELLIAIQIDYNRINAFITRVNAFQFYATGSAFQYFS